VTSLRPSESEVEGTTPSNIHIDPDYSTRRGYDSEFLGSGEHAVPLPSLPDELVPLAATNSLATSEPKYLLPYHHFSVVLNKERGLAFFTAVNIDGKLQLKPERMQDHWFFDPRVPKEEQTGKDVYEKNPLDLGHLVRRLDPAWGSSAKTARLANDDTFHFTNCSPQHQDFNRNKTSWAGLEDYILKNAGNLHFKANVFTGPVLAKDDDAYDGVQLPRQFWKVVTMVKTDGGLSATAYLLSQKHLIDGLRPREEFSYGAYKTYQVPVTKVEKLSRLSFGLAHADPLATREIGVTAKELDRPEEMVL
jgi:endonuclease G, mitochondrial